MRWKYQNNSQSNISHYIQCSFMFLFKPLVYQVRKEMFLKKYSALIERKIVHSNRIFVVPDLKHLCRLFNKKFILYVDLSELMCHSFSNLLPASRCSIREVLRKNFQLPRGIKLLKVPRSLKRYLDLLQDWEWNEFLLWL